MAVEWAPSVCNVKHCSYLQPNVDLARFNIHGLWPSRDTKGHGPSSCSTSRFNFEGLSAQIQQELEENWNGLYHPTQQFLSHEWSKHGTCWVPQPAHTTVARLLSESRRKSRKHREHKHSEDFVSSAEEAILSATEDTDLQEKFFRKVLDIAKTFDVAAMLAANGVEADSERSYPTRTVHSALEQGLGTSQFMLKCETIHQEKYLQEVRFCLSLDYTAIDCPSSVTSGSNCGENGQLRYPRLIQRSNLL
eukprot:TRINITY_DN10389_c0_g2_i3.p1 TRINITY_DN10389_c0_g2~~TRINITY_DN10389_c0_g2_i3.p1  ORF type:complete len:249 (-),score=38.46 TRINITY_DN10389_c0_g2_i3:147-893(-)